ncbi:hypothetical protein BJ138DRAFT_995157 [Hygrophoropsis aurantiaca]|uniref:Uncharacterized protein n=1 Tax=Hygrophoropsis aurantiaca TaxID=72124 RepID=A0ACB8ATY3_9AGAM|nr:hypothetical protein BJ138DRAFT_995157 [Hygrophoropsis aurantiaca]
MNRTASAMQHINPSAIMTVPGDLSAAITMLNPIVSPWAPLLEKIKLVSDAMDTIAEIHPYMNMAWTILSAAHKTIFAQADRDDAVHSLWDSLHDMYQCILEAEPLKANDVQKEDIHQMVEQTVECAQFIQHYALHPNFGKRLVKNIFSGTDSRISGFTKRIKDLKRALKEKTILQTNICTMRIEKELKELAKTINLNNMPYAKGAKYQTEKQCLPGTRTEIIDEICNWVNQQGDQVPNVMFLSGVAGSGKSAIAHTVAHIFDKMKRLGSSFCFDQSNATTLHPGVLFSTIARDLVDFDNQYHLSLSAAVEKRTTRTTASITQQFEEFIRKPASQLRLIGPILIVIDALDESGDEDKREGILSVLGGKFPGLPGNIRILVTGHPEQDILNALSPSKHLFIKEMSSIESDKASYDIYQFVKNRLQGVQAKLDKRWPNGEWVNLIVKKSDKLFQWAFTACEFIRKYKSGQTPVQQLEIVLGLLPNSTKFNGLDGLYKNILTHSFEVGDAESMRSFKSVMSTILVALRPFSALELEVIHNDTDVQPVISFLGSVLTGVATNTGPIQPLHISFRDFLTDEERSVEFYVDVNCHQEYMGLACLRIMKTGLCFNICELENPQVFNDKVPHLKDHISQSISSHLSYACQYWMNHITNIVEEKLHIEEEIKDFLHIRLLWWLEVLSLLNNTSAMTKELEILVDWTSVSFDPVIKTFTQDALKFVRAFAEAVTQNTLHLYISALLWSPICSPVASQYREKYDAKFKIYKPNLIHWPALEKTIVTSSQMFSVALSLDGKLSGVWKFATLLRSEE